MKYLDAFLERAQPELTELTKAPSVGSVSFSPRRAAHRPAADHAFVHGLAVHEVLIFPAGLLASLAVPTTLVLDVRGIDRLITVAAHAGCSPATFGPDEWQVLFSAAESERAWPAQLLAWCERKRIQPRWNLTETEATGPVTAPKGQHWTVARVLQQLGAGLRAVVVEGGGAC